MENNKKRSNSNNKKKNKTKKKKAIVISLVILLLIISAVVGAGYYQLSKMNKTKISKNNDDLGINKEAQEKIKELDPNNDIINIALFGLDRREKNEPSRSDAVMIATIDKKHDKIKITSIMRDLYVDVPGHGKTKLTHAYAYGGPQLAIKTLNQTFNLNIKDFVSIDFYNMEELIDSIGGVQVNITKEELSAVNGMMDELAHLGKYNPPYIKKPGLQTLNGKQALAYTRTRYTGNGDFERTERQRTVLNALFNKVMQSGASKLPSMVSSLLPYTETSISSGNILGLGTTVLGLKSRTLEQERFPLDQYAKGETIEGIWYLVADLKTTADQIQRYIYEDIKPNVK